MAHADGGSGARAGVSGDGGALPGRAVAGPHYLPLPRADHDDGLLRGRSQRHFPICRRRRRPPSSQPLADRRAAAGRRVVRNAGARPGLGRAGGRRGTARAGQRGLLARRHADPPGPAAAHAGTPEVRAFDGARRDRLRRDPVQRRDRHDVRQRRARRGRLAELCAPPCAPADRRGRPRRPNRPAPRSRAAPARRRRGDGAS